MLVIIRMNDNTINKKILTSPAKAEQIIQYCRQKFINILPNNSARLVQQNKKPFNAQQPSEISSINNINYKKQQVKQVMRQLSIFLQLIIQNCLLSSDTKIKAQSNFLSRDLDEFETLIYNRTRSKLPFYQVECKDMVGRGLDLKIPPQVSLYQDPLLFYIYTRFAQEQLFINHPIHVNRQERIQILKKHVPFLNPLFIPIISERLETKAKFSEQQDRLLLIMVKSKLDIGQYKVIYFPNREQAQIKNRIKNLCGNGKQINNPIKDFRLNQYIPLTGEEIEQLIRGYSKFGPRWAVISKYYGVRSAQFLESEYTNDDRLIKRRQKQKIASEYTSLKQVLQTKMQQIAKRKQHQMIMQIQNSCQQIEIIDQQKNDDQKEEIQVQIYQEPQYKVINHLTFEYQEI